MEQEKLFEEYYKGISPEEVEEEIKTLANIRLSVDFYEYISTDPEKLLAIIHFNNLEEKYGIRIVFDNDEDKDNFLTDHTGNMAIIFRFNNDVYRISTMIDSVSNSSIYDSFVEQVLFLLNNYKSEIISNEETTLNKLEKEINEKFKASSNLMWYVMNSPKNLAEILENINKETGEFEECEEDTKEQEQLLKEQLLKEQLSQEHCSCSCSCEECDNQERDIICPMITIYISVMFAICLNYIGYLMGNQ